MIQYFDDTGQTDLYVRVIKGSNLYINDGVNYVINPSWINSAIDLTENTNVKGCYFASMPFSGIGLYYIAVYKQAGGSAADTDDRLQVWQIVWDGVNEVLLSAVKFDTATIVALIEVGGVGDITAIKAVTDVLSDTLVEDSGGNHFTDEALAAAATSAKQDTMETTLDIVAADVDGLNGEAMRGTNNAALEVNATTNTAAIIAAMDAYLADGGTIDVLLDTIIANGTSNTATILALINTYLANGGTIDILIDAIKAKTDQLQFNSDSDVYSMPRGVGAGAVTMNYYVYTDEDAQTGPIADCKVWITTDEAGLVIVASGYTNAFGLVTFYVDPGTYYLWRKKTGYNFTNPDTEVVS